MQNGPLTNKHRNTIKVRKGVVTISDASLEVVLARGRTLLTELVGSSAITVSAENDVGNPESYFVNCDDFVVTVGTTAGGLTEALRIDGTTQEATFKANMTVEGHIIRGATDQAMGITGGSTVNLGANIFLYGEAHGTKGKDIDLRTDGTTRLGWDDSETQWNITGNTQLVGNFTGNGYIKPGVFTVANAPAATTSGEGAMIFVDNGAAGSPVIAFSDGTNWLRCDTLAQIASS